MNDYGRGVLIGFTVYLMVLLIVFPIVAMTGMWEMMGFDGLILVVVRGARRVE